MEGLVRQTRREAPEAHMVFVYTIRELSVLQYDLPNATTPDSVAASEAVAEHYGIPRIYLGLEIVKLAKLGRVRWRQGAWGSQEEVVQTGDEFWFASDAIHPHALTGCKEYTKAIERCISPIHGQSSTPTSARPLSPSPLDPLNFENATWISPGNVQLASGIDKIKVSDLNNVYPSGNLDVAYKAQRPGDTFTLVFCGLLCRHLCCCRAFFRDTSPDIGWRNTYPIPSLLQFQSQQPPRFLSFAY